MLWSYSTGLDLTDRGLQFGDGLFETLLFWSGEIWLQQEHIARLTFGCERLGLELPRTELTQVLQAATHAARNQSAQGLVGKLIVSAQSQDRGYAREQPCPVNLHAGLFALAQDPSATPAPVDVMVSQMQLASQPALAGIKHLNRLEQVLAQRDLNRQLHFETLMCDQQDQLIEGSYCNLWLVRRGELFTPQLDRCGVAGVLRQRLAADFHISEREIPLVSLADYDELIVGNSVTGLRSVAQVFDCHGQLIHRFTDNKRYQSMQDWLQAELAKLALPPVAQ